VNIQLLRICKKVRRTILKASYEAHACHIGSALSCVEILVDLYFNRMKPHDIFIFSKASGVSALYAVLAEKGIIPHNKVAYYLKNYPLADSHVDGIEFSVGSLGHGLPYAIGMAYADNNKQVYCLLGDGDIDEGTFWESILFASHYKLNNLHIIIDRNKIQACGYTENVLALDKALDCMKELFPIEIVETVKGKGVSFLENRVESHYMNLTKEQLEQALVEVENS
jgi:transketolase